MLTRRDDPYRVLSMNEARTLELMLDLYCSHHHRSSKNELCRECRTLLDYALERLKNCPLQPEKPVCSNCRIHCYRPDMREKIKAVMRFSGPRMIYRHPVIAMQYVWKKSLDRIACRSGRGS